jgi:hypothetical protein
MENFSAKLSKEKRSKETFTTREPAYAIDKHCFQTNLAKIS